MCHGCGQPGRESDPQHRMAGVTPTKQDLQNLKWMIQEGGGLDPYELADTLDGLIAAKIVMANDPTKTVCFLLRREGLTWVVGVDCHGELHDNDSEFDFVTFNHYDGDDQNTEEETQID